MWIQGVVSTLRRVEVRIVDERLPPDWKRQDDGAVATTGCNRIKQLAILRRHHVVDAFPVIGDKGVPIDEAPDAVRDSIGDPGNDHAAVAVADEDGVRNVIL